jgi:hypothetical protein
MTAIATVRNLLRRPVDHAIPSDVRKRYRHLYAEQVRELPDGSQAFGAARLWRREGINVLYVRGDRFEMAFQHGRLLSDAIAAGTLAQCGEIPRHGIRNSIGDGPLAKLVLWYARHAIAEPMLRRGLERAREQGEDSLLEGYGLSEGSGLSVDTIFNAPLGPEVAQTLLGKTSGLAVGSEPNQCTSFTAWGSKTAGGELVIGRNTDYPLTGYYDEHPTVIYFEPTDGAQRYMAVTSAGCHNAATGGMNEAGLYVTTHTVPASTVSEEGLPVLMVGQAILRTASTIDEAEALVMEAKPAAGWNFHIVSTHERRAVTFEMSSARIAKVESSGETHFTTNHYRARSMDEHHLFVNATVETDTRARMDRCVEMVDAANGALDAAGAAAILGDKYDRTVGKVRSGPNCVSASTTVSSSVWLPDSGKVFVANGTAPVSQNTYVELPALSHFDAESFGSSDYETIDQDRFRREHPAVLEAEQIYQRARQVFEYDNDAGAAVELMQEALVVDDSDPGMHLHLALYALRAGREGIARSAVTKMLAIEWDPQRTRVARYLRGRFAASDGDRDAALDDLRAVAESPDTCPRLAAAARKIERKLSRRKRVALGANELSPMSWMPDAFRYTGLL